MTSATDKQGRKWLKFSEINEKSVIEVDSGFTCIDPSIKHPVFDDLDGHGPYVFCAEGKHHLIGQVEDGYCIGCYDVV